MDGAGHAQGGGEARAGVRGAVRANDLPWPAACTRGGGWRGEREGEDAGDRGEGREGRGREKRGGGGASEQGRGTGGGGTGVRGGAGAQPGSTQGPPSRSLRPLPVPALHGQVGLGPEHRCPSAQGGSAKACAAQTLPEKSLRARHQGGGGQQFQAGRPPWWWWLPRRMWVQPSPAQRMLPASVTASTRASSPACPPDSPARSTDRLQLAGDVRRPDPLCRDGPGVTSLFYWSISTISAMADTPGWGRGAGGDPWCPLASGHVSPMAASVFTQSPSLASPRANLSRL